MRKAYSLSLHPVPDNNPTYLPSRNELLEEIELQARELRLLHEMRRALVGAYDLLTIYRTAVEKISAIYDFSLVAIYQLIDDELCLQSQAGNGSVPAKIQLGKDIGGRVALTGKGVFLPSFQQEDCFQSADTPMTSLICVPLIGPGFDILGILTIECDDRYRLTERDFKTCEALAEHVTLAAAQALAYARESRRLAQVALLNHVGRELATALDEEQIVDRVTGPVRQALNLYSVNIGLIQGDILVFRLSQTSEQQEYRYPLATTNSLACHSARTGELIICHDVSQEPRYLFVPAIPDTKAEVVIPLRSAGQIIGILDVESDGSTLFDDDMIILLKTLADQTSVALTNARRFTDLKRHSQALNESNRQLAEANRLKSEFLSNVSHELRTPLNAIIGYVDMIQSGFYGDVPDDMNDPLDRVFRNGRRLLSLINDVLDMASLEAGKVQLSQEDALVYEILNSLYDINRPLAEEKGLQFYTEMLAGTPRIVHVDITRLRQVANILLSNAVKFTHAGCVTLKAAPAVLNDKPAYSLLVVDTGIGIPDTQFENIFQEFRQLDGSSTRQYAGTGLGLALARRLVQQMRGQITVSSEAGHGSTFVITLPIEGA